MSYKYIARNKFIFKEEWIGTFLCIYIDPSSHPLHWTGIGSKVNFLFILVPISQLFSLQKVQFMVLNVKCFEWFIVYAKILILLLLLSSNSISIYYFRVLFKSPLNAGKNKKFANFVRSKTHDRMRGFITM